MKALAAVGAGVLAVGMARARLRNWGATREEIDAAHPGDDLVAGPVTTTTYAVTVQAPAETVWSWLVQIGQDRGGMYSYEWLENLFGLDIHNGSAGEAQYRSSSSFQTSSAGTISSSPQVVRPTVPPLRSTRRTSRSAVTGWDT